MVKPAILKAVQRVEQRHVEEANHLPNGVDGEEANNHTLQKTHNTIKVTIAALREFIQLMCF